MEDKKEEVKFEFLVASNEIEYRVLCDKLKKSGIRVRIQDDLPDLHYLGATASFETKRIYVQADKYEEAKKIVELDEDKKPHWQKKKRDRKVAFEVVRVLFSFVLLAGLFYIIVQLLNNL